MRWWHFCRITGSDTCPACCSEPPWAAQGGPALHCAGRPSSIFSPLVHWITPSCSIPAVWTFLTSLSTSMPCRDTPKTCRSRAYLCHIGKLCVCVCESQETREGVVWGMLEGGARREKMRKGRGMIPHCTLQHLAQQHPVQGESPSKTRLSRKCNKAKIGGGSIGFLA